MTVRAEGGAAGERMPGERIPGAASAPGALVEATLLRPVRSGNTFEETVSRLLQTIRLGVAQPGERLPSERDLAALLDVSRDTVRDALRSLGEAGYVVSRRGRYGGTFVRDALPSAGARTGGGTPGADAPGTPGADAPPRTSAAIDDVLVLREVLEVGAVRRAAGHPLDAAQRDELRAQLHAASRASGNDYRRFDSRLHLLFGELAGSPSLVSLLADSRTHVNALLDEIPLLPRNIEHSNRQHEQIVAAVLQGDESAAARAMTEHLAGTAALLRGFLG